MYAQAATSVRTQHHGLELFRLLNILPAHAIPCSPSFFPFFPLFLSLGNIGHRIHFEEKRRNAKKRNAKKRNAKKRNAKKRNAKKRNAKRGKE